MYCDKHENIARFCSIQESICISCGQKMKTMNAPPINKVCGMCANHFEVCELCGEETDVYSKEYNSVEYKMEIENSKIDLNWKK